MSYELLDPQPELRAEDLAWEKAGPGLYDDGEVALRLDDGTIVAVSVTPRWLENGGGVAFAAYARWIDEDGATHLDPHGQHTETVMTDNVPAPEIERLTLPAIARELLLAVLGEPATLIDGRPLLAWSDEVRLNASIRKAISLSLQTGPKVSAADFLELGDAPAKKI
jgi:hypothetical protein